jgi:hypothetical protein
MDRAAGGVSEISSYLRDRNVDDMLADAEDFARRQPELFLGGAFALGMLAARFFKSSSRPQEQGTLVRGGYGQQEYGWQRDQYAMTRQPRPLPRPEGAERERDFPRQGREEW